MLKRKIILTIGIILMLSQITSCSKAKIPEVSVEGSISTTISTEVIAEHYLDNLIEDEKEKNNPSARKMDKNKDNFHKLNEEVISKISLDSSDDSLTLTDFYALKIKEVKITTTEEAEIDIDHCEYAKFPEVLSDDSCLQFIEDKDKLKNAKILYLKADIRRIFDGGTLHIDSLTPHYKVDDYCYSVGCRAYFNYDNEVKKDDGTIYMFPGQTKEITGAWVIDPEILEIDNFDPANLYIVINSPQDIRLPRDFIDLGLGEQ